MKLDLMNQFNQPGTMVEIWVSKSDMGKVTSRLRVRRLKKNGKRWAELRGLRVDNISSISALMARAEKELRREG